MTSRNNKLLYASSCSIFSNTSTAKYRLLCKICFFFVKIAPTYILRMTSSDNNITIIFSQAFKINVHSIFGRSEEHTSELQSRFDLVCRLLLEKKKRKPNSLNSREQ